MLENATEKHREKIILYLLNSASDIFSSYVSDGTPEDTFIGNSIDQSIVGIENRIGMSDHIWHRRNDEEVMVCEKCGQGEEMLERPCPGRKNPAR